MSRIPTTIKPGSPCARARSSALSARPAGRPAPHAHFEIRLDGKPMNPLEMKATGGRQLTGKNLAAFRQHMQKIVAMMKARPRATMTSAG